MREQSTNDYAREVRETIVKSGLTGVAATVLAVTIFSPAGFGGMIGTSLASGLGLAPSDTPSGDVYANLPAYPSPLSQEEVADIQSQLARTNASLALTRAATEARIEHIRTIALSEGVVSFTPMPRLSARVIAAPVDSAPADDGLWAPASEPAAPLAESEPITATLIPAGGGGVEFASFRDSHLDLADLMFAHENF